MLVSKSFFVAGQRTYRDGAYHNSLMDLLDEEINKFLDGVDEKGGELVDLKPQVQIQPGASEASAFVIAIVRYPNKKASVDHDEPAAEPVFPKKKK